MPEDGFEWVENTSQFNWDFIEIYNKDSNERPFLKAGVKHPEILNDLHDDLPFLPARMKI